MLFVEAILGSLLEQGDARARTHEIANRTRAEEQPDLGRLQRRLLWVLRSQRPDVAVSVTMYVVGHLVLSSGSIALPLFIGPPSLSVGPMTESLREGYITSDRGDALKDPVSFLEEVVLRGQWHSGGDLPESSPYDRMMPWIARIFREMLDESVGRAPLSASITSGLSVWEPSGLRTPTDDEAMFLLMLHQLDQSIRGIKDWIHATSPDLSSLSIMEAMGRAQEWHREIAIGSVGRQPKGKRGAVRGKKIWRLPCGWNIWRLGPSDLTEEGDLMGHCVGHAGYDELIRKGDVDILSVRDGEDRPVFTAEVSLASSTLVQLKERFNAAPGLVRRGARLDLCTAEQIISDIESEAGVIFDVERAEAGMQVCRYLRSRGVVLTQCRDIQPLMSYARALAEIRRRERMAARDEPSSAGSA